LPTEVVAAAGGYGAAGTGAENPSAATSWTRPIPGSRPSASSS